MWPILLSFACISFVNVAHLDRFVCLSSGLVCQCGLSGQVCQFDSFGRVESVCEFDSLDWFVILTHLDRFFNSLFFCTYLSISLI